MSWKLRLLTVAFASFLVVGCGGPTDEPPADKPAGAADEIRQPPAEETPPTEKPEEMKTKSLEPDDTPSKAEPTPPKADPPKPKVDAPKPKPGPNPALLDPSQAQGKGPTSFKAEFDTTKGKFVIQVTRSWSPIGADRFYNLVNIGYFTDITFFRVVEGFMAQFGMHGDPKIGQAWRQANIKDDPVVESNKRGFISFAKTGAPNSRSVQFFINYRDNSPLDPQGFSPFGKVTSGMEVVDNLYKGYGDGAPRGRGPDQGRILMEGNSYLKQDFPKLDYIKKARIVK